MSGPPPPPRWFDRRFDGRIALDLHPNVRARLHGVAARVEEATRGLSRADLTRRIGSGWSIQTNAGHLLDLEDLWATRVDELLRGERTLSAADVTNAKTERARHDAAELRDLVAELRAARARWLTALTGAPEGAYARSALHPRLGTELRLLDHLVFVAEHDDHHIARILALRAAIEAEQRP